MNLREIVLDTETTGIDPAKGDRLIEIGCIELQNYIPTGKHYHTYLNPQRPVSHGAYEVHGISNEFLEDKPVFSAIAEEFLDFIGTSRLVIHNAPFDMGFLNTELAMAGYEPIKPDQVLDTLLMARRKHKGMPNSLDALCKRYNIDNSGRTKHGALIDAKFLGEVYLELMGGKQADMELVVVKNEQETSPGIMSKRTLRENLIINENERESHAHFIKTLGSSAIWNDYISKNDKS